MTPESEYSSLGPWSVCEARRGCVISPVAPGVSLHPREEARRRSVHFQPREGDRASRRQHRHLVAIGARDTGKKAEGPLEDEERAGGARGAEPRGRPALGGVSSLFPPRCDHREAPVPLPRYGVGARAGPGILPQPRARRQVMGTEWCLQRFPSFPFAPQWGRLFQKTLAFLLNSSFKSKIKLRTHRTECQRFFLKRSLRCRVKYFQQCARQRYSYDGAMEHLSIGAPEWLVPFVEALGGALSCSHRHTFL